MTDSKIIFEMIKEITNVQLKIAQTLDKISTRLELSEAVDLLIRQDLNNNDFDSDIN